MRDAQIEDTISLRPGFKPCQPRPPGRGVVNTRFIDLWPFTNKVPRWGSRFLSVCWDTFKYTNDCLDEWMSAPIQQSSIHKHSPVHAESLSKLTPVPQRHHHNDVVRVYNSHGTDAKEPSSLKDYFWLEWFFEGFLWDISLDHLSVTDRKSVV